MLGEALVRPGAPGLGGLVRVAGGGGPASTAAAAIAPASETAGGAGGGAGFCATGGGVDGGGCCWENFAYSPAPRPTATRPAAIRSMVRTGRSCIAAHPPLLHWQI